MKIICATLVCLGALLNGRAEQGPAPASGDNAVPKLPTAASTNQLNPILNGVFLKTDWRATKNPFKLEEQELSAEAPDRTEQMEVIGLTKMPDEDGALRTYAFVNKTSDRRPPPDDLKGRKPGRAAEAEPPALQETHILQAFPEIVNESTTPTEEQAENSSIMLINQQLWFLGTVTISNKMSAVFWPYGAYPVQEESLRLFDLKDPLLNGLAIRKTKGGEKIGGDKDINVLARVDKAKLLREMQNKENPSSNGKRPEAKPAPMAPPARKPEMSGNVTKDVQGALQGH